MLAAAARREVDTTPVWFMRQAGRSLPEYREIRKQHTLFEVCRQPELCAEVTLQPVRAHGVDAAVLFADIMLPVLGMGVDVELVESSPGGASWGPPRRLSSQTMRPEWMANTNSGRMLADYISVHYAGARPLVLWVLASEPVGPSLRQAVYATRG